MNQSFYIGALGAHQQQKHLNLQGNNIANINTTGFKAEKARFRDLMRSDLKAIDDVQLPVGTGTHLWTSATDFTPGAIADTGRSQDYAIVGRGFFALKDLATGEISYTRNGGFYMASLNEAYSILTENGQMVEGINYYLSDGKGRFVLDAQEEMIPVVDPNAEYPVGVFDFENYNGMLHLDDTRFMPVEKNGPVMAGEGTVYQRMLEMGNGDLAEQMTKVIEAQRAYGLALKVVSTSDDIETTINGLRT